MNCSDMGRSDAPVQAKIDLAVGPRRTVLIVTADKSFSAVVARVLQQEGYEV